MAAGLRGAKAKESGLTCRLFDYDPKAPIHENSVHCQQTLPYMGYGVDILPWRLGLAGKCSVVVVRYLFSQLG